MNDRSIRLGMACNVIVDGQVVRGAICAIEGFRYEVRTIDGMRYDRSWRQIVEASVDAETFAELEPSLAAESYHGDRVTNQPDSPSEA